ncbi:MAG: hypothetical protein NTW87_22840 [Planctomycetota bacterium]|nr:hypothetical protein [Planctomycetota bacterium]
MLSPARYAAPLGCAVAALLLNAALAADTVTLTNGQTVEGEVVRNEPEEPDVIVATAAGFVGVARKDIKELKVDQAARAELARRREKVEKASSADELVIAPRAGEGRTGAAAESARTHFELYEWAAAQRLNGAAREELAATLAAAPGHEGAHKALGHVLRDGKWVQESATAALQDGGAATPVGKMAPEKAEYFAQVAQLCQVLSPAGNAAEGEKKMAMAALQRDRAKAGEMVLACLNARNVPEQAVRLGALKAVETLNARDAKTSFALGAAAAADPYPDVRQAATALVKARNDELGMRTMIGHLLASYDETGRPRDKVLHDNAIAALQELGDKRVYQALVYYVTLELRLTNISEGSLTTRQINTYSVNSGANANVVVPLALPIQFPELNMQRVKTTVCVPAISALQDLSGQDFGPDADKWGKWLEKQK